jgi:cytochrome b561
MATESNPFPLYAKCLHGGIAISGLAAFLSGELAEEGMQTTGYYLHACLGLSLAIFIGVRIYRGFTAAAPLGFSGWSPFSPRQWSRAMQDLRDLLQLRVPERGIHEGLSGLTQAFGLILFSWMALSGAGLFLLASMPETHLLEVLEELHEVGESLIPLYLVLHVGSVVVHSVAGKPIWQRMWRFKPDS